MKFKYLILVLTVMISSSFINIKFNDNSLHCIKKKDRLRNIKQINDSINIYSEKVTRLNINLKKYKNKKMFLENWFLNNYIGIKVKISIEEINDIKRSVLIYKISLSNDLPTSLNKKYSVVYLKKLNMCFLIPIEYNKLNQINKDLMIGGYRENREFEYYYIYQFKKDFLKLIMDTSKDFEYGIKVGYFRDDECLEYLPNRFNFQIIDNKEIRFIGKINNYCKPNMDRDENDTIPLDITNSKIIYKYSKSKNRWIYQKE